MSDVSRQELLIHTVARLLMPCRSVAVGASSPIPGAGALLARDWAAQESPSRRLFLTILGSRRHNSMTSGGVELFDMAAQGRLDAFFLGGGQTLRGVAYRDVGPKVVNGSGTDQHPIGGATLGLVSAEYSVPIFEAVRIATFSDAGNVTADSYDFANVWKNYCWTYGAGLRIDIPGFPIRFDYAIPIKKDSELTRDNHFIFWIGFE